jgi:nicotinamidase-related amidase
MDLQAINTNNYADRKGPLLDAVKESIAVARKQAIPVIYVVVAFRKGYPEVSANNKLFGMIRNSGRNFDSPEAAQIDPAIAPQDGDFIVQKKRVSAFCGSDLEVILRGQGIQHLVLTGIATSGVVLSTLREAADKDYRLTVLSDCCLDMDEEVHRVLTTKVFVRQADVMDHAQWIRSF